MNHIVTVSPKGQITIPSIERKHCPYNKYLLERQGNTLILRPIELKILENDDLSDFSLLSQESFEFWNNEADDVYQDFYLSDTKT